MTVGETWARRSTLVLLLSLTMVACSGTARLASAAPSGPEAVALAPYADKYAMIVAPVDSAIESFTSRSGALAHSASVDDFVVIARPFADAIATVDTGLRQVRWPATVLHAIKVELAADKSLRLYLLGTLDVTLMLSLWRDQVIGAANRVQAVRRVVSIDLGLLQPSAK